MMRKLVAVLLCTAALTALPPVAQVPAVLGVWDLNVAAVLPGGEEVPLVLVFNKVDQ